MSKSTWLGGTPQHDTCIHDQLAVEDGPYPCQCRVWDVQHANRPSVSLGIAYMHPLLALPDHRRGALAHGTIRSIIKRVTSRSGVTPPARTQLHGGNSPHRDPFKRAIHIRAYRPPVDSLMLDYFFVKNFERVLLGLAADAADPSWSARGCL